MPVTQFLQASCAEAWFGGWSDRAHGNAGSAGEQLFKSGHLLLELGNASLHGSDVGTVAAGGLLQGIGDGTNLFPRLARDFGFENSS